MGSLKSILKQMDTDPLEAFFRSKVFQTMAQQSHEKQILREQNSAGFHVSNLLVKPEDFCARRHVLAAIERRKQKDKKVEMPTHSQQTLKIFLRGNTIHEEWQDLFCRMGPSLIEQKRYSTMLDLTGTPDAIIEFMGKEWIVEIKSMRSNVFWHTKTVPMNARIQCTFYQYLATIPRGMVICDCKDTQDFKVFFVDFDYNLIRDYIDQHLEVMDYLARKVIPQKECIKVKDKMAKKCKYSDCHCFA